MNLTMLELVRMCVHINNKPDKLLQNGKREERIFIDFDLKYFWQWTDFQSYVEAVMSFLALGESLLSSCSVQIANTHFVAGCVVMFFLLHVDPFVEAVGFMAVFTEAMLGTPQFYKNMTNKSTFGMSLSMVLMCKSDLSPVFN